MSQKVRNSQGILLAMFLSIFSFKLVIALSHASVALAGGRLLVRERTFIFVKKMVSQCSRSCNFF